MVEYYYSDNDPNSPWYLYSVQVNDTLGYWQLSTDLWSNSIAIAYVLTNDLICPFSTLDNWMTWNYESNEFNPLNQNTSCVGM
jgi:hypothetical protein